MPHEPIQVHIGSEDTKAVTRSTKRAGAIAILMGNHSVLFEYLKQPVKLFMNITNAIPGKRQTGRRSFETWKQAQLFPRHVRFKIWLKNTNWVCTGAQAFGDQQPGNVEACVNATQSTGLEMRPPAPCSKHTHHTYYILVHRHLGTSSRVTLQHAYTISMKIPDVRYFSEHMLTVQYIHTNTGRFQNKLTIWINPCKYQTYGTFSEYTHHMCTYHTCTSIGHSVLFRTYAHY